MRKRLASSLAFLLCVLAVALPAAAWAASVMDSDPDATVTLSSIGSSSHEITVADWTTEQDRKTNLEGKKIIELDADVQELANIGTLLWAFECTGTCDECRSQTLSAYVKFYNSAGEEIQVKTSDGTKSASWSDSSSGYDTTRQTRSLGYSDIVPAGTVRIEVQALNHVGTKSDLELWGSINISTTSNIDGAAFNNSYVLTVAGDEFYEKSSEEGAALSSKTISFDYLKNDSLFAGEADFFATVVLDETAQHLAAQGYLTYGMSFTAECGICRTMTATCSVRCYDSEGNELSSGQWNVEESHYSSSEQHREFSSGDVFIPENTATIKLTCNNHTGTGSELNLYGSLTINSLLNPDYWHENEVADDTAEESESSDTSATGTQAQFSVYESYNADGTGSGAYLYLTDVFKGLSMRVGASDSDALFKSAIMNQNVLFNWSQLAYDIIKTEGAYVDHANIGFDSAYGSGHYADLVYQFTHQTDGYTDTGVKDASAWTSSSGLRQAASFTAVTEDAFSDLAAQRKKLSSRAYGNVEASDFAEEHGLADSLAATTPNAGVDVDSYDGLVYYTFVNTTDQRGAEQVYYYDSFILAFYDFEYAPVVDEGTYSIEPVTTVEPDVRADSQVNDVVTSATLSVASTWEESSTATNEVSSASSIEASSTLGLDIGATAKFGIDGIAGIEASRTASASWTTGEAYSFSESSATSDTVSQSDSTGTSIELPPYSIGIVSTDKSVSVLKQEYDCPLAIQFKVMVISNTGAYYDDGVGVLDFGAYDQGSFACAIGYNEQVDGAVKSVSASKVLRSEFDATGLSKSGINGCTAPESKMYDGDANLKTGANLISYLGTHLPVTYEDAVYSDEFMHIEYDVEVYPTRPLAYTALTSANSNSINEKLQIYLAPGQSYNLTANVSVAGYNAVDAEYIDFMGSEGYFDIVDGNGDPVPSSVASIRRNEATGNTYLDISSDCSFESDTAIYVVYHINDGVYSYVQNASQEYGDGSTGNGYTSDSDLTKRATLDVIIEAVDSVAATSDSAAGEEAGEEAVTSAEAEPATDAADATELAFSMVTQRMNELWDAYVAATGYEAKVIDPNATITEQRFAGLAYGAYCVFAQGDLKSLHPIDDHEAYIVLAEEWAKDNGIPEAYAAGVDTLAEAVVCIADQCVSWK